MLRGCEVMKLAQDYSLSNASCGISGVEPPASAVRDLS
jgi:hypothetical protein